MVYTAVLQAFHNTIIHYLMVLLCMHLADVYAIETTRQITPISPSRINEDANTVSAVTVNAIYMDRSSPNSERSINAAGNRTEVDQNLQNAGITIKNGPSSVSSFSDTSTSHDNNDHDESNVYSNNSGHLPSSRESRNVSDDVNDNTNSNDKADVDDDVLLSYNQYVIATDVILKIEYVILPCAICVTIVNVVVFLQKPMLSSTSRYVVGLSLAQILYLCVGVGYLIMMSAVENPMKRFGFYVYALYFLNYTFAVTRRGSYVVMCMVSLERLYAMARPLHVKGFLLVRFPASCVIAAYFLTAAFHFYLLAMVTVDQVAVTPTGEPVYGFLPTKFYLQHPDVLDSFSVAAKILFTYLPLVALIVLNALTLGFLRRHAIMRRSMKTSADDDAESKRQRQLTITILGATLCYIILSLPFALHSIIGTLTPEYNMSNPERGLGYFFQVIQRFSYICILLSCFTDFLSFLLLSSAYRRTFFRFFRACRGQREADETHTVVDSFTSQTTD